MNIVYRYRLLRSDAIRLVKRHASRISGFDEHLAKVHPPVGLLRIGILIFDIETLTFVNGLMRIQARAGTTQAGRCEGDAVIMGMDGKPALKGAHLVPFMGVKTLGSTWQVDYVVNLENVRTGEIGEWNVTETTPQPA